MNESTVKNLTKIWVEEVVIKLNLCPFAHEGWGEGYYEMVVSFEDDIKQRLKSFDHYIKEKRNNLENFGTSLYIFPHTKESFLSFYNFTALIEEELAYNNLNQDFQVVAFHPEFRFEGEKSNARGNYVNRSPFPLLHILKVSDVNEVIQRVGENKGLEISLRNKDFLEKLPESEFYEKVLKHINGHWKK